MIPQRIKLTRVSYWAESVSPGYDTKGCQSRHGIIPRGVMWQKKANNFVTHLSNLIYNSHSLKNWLKVILLFRFLIVVIGVEFLLFADQFFPHFKNRFQPYFPNFLTSLFVASRLFGFIVLKHCSELVCNFPPEYSNSIK